jgi:hypothetical protein
MDLESCGALAGEWLAGLRYSQIQSGWTADPCFVPSSTVSLRIGKNRAQFRLEMRFSLIISLVSATVLPSAFSLAAPAESGPGGVALGAGPSQEKSVSSGYPFVYRQVGYLATTGPAPMRFGAAVPGGSERTPPRIAAAKKPELSRTAEGMARTEAIESYRSIFGRGIPVPPGSPEGGPKIPDAFLDAGSGSGVGGANNEVLEFFQQPSPDPDTQKRQNRYLFDPVFQAAKPPAVGGAVPQSRATYRN